jgi:hypothetical protein
VVNFRIWLLLPKEKGLQYTLNGKFNESQGQFKCSGTEKILAYHENPIPTDQHIVTLLNELSIFIEGLTGMMMSILNQ